MNRISIIIITLFISTFAFSQELTQVVRGSVIDKDNRQVLTGATVQVLNTSIGTATDLDGKFRLDKVPVGRKTIKISYLGYEDVLLSDIVINSAKEVVLTIEMQEKVNNIKEVTVKGKINKAAANNELVQVSGRSFTIDQANRYAGALADPSRMASNFAGVAGGGNDQRNDIVIRGNTPLGLLWRLEGADIPNPNHFSNQGANGGPVSILNNNTLANSDFLTGAFPAEYGNATSGVFDLKMRNGNNEKREFIGQIGFNGVELLAEGPFKKGGASYLVSYRYSTLSFFNALGIQFGNSGVPFYQDLTFRINLPKTKLGMFSVWGIGGTSSTRLLDSDKDEEERKKLAYAQDVDFSSRMGVAGITHVAMLSKSSYLKTVLSVSGERNRTKVDSLGGVAFDQGFYTFGSTSQSGKIAVHSFINKKINARHSVKFGVIGSRLFGSSHDSVWVNEISSYRSQLSFDEQTYLAQSYVNWNYRITSSLTLNTGVHFNYYALNKSKSVEPRASIKWAFSPKQSISFGYGLHSQVQPMIVYFEKTLIDSTNKIYTQTNKDLGMSRSHHFVLGYEWMISDDTRLKAETYYQYLFDLPVTQTPGYFSTINTGADFGATHMDSLVNKGIGRNYGIELTLERFFSKGFYYLVTTSIYKSEYRASDLKWRNTAFSGNYVVNALAGKEISFSRNRVLIINLKTTFAGGRRYVPIDEAQSVVKRERVLIEDRAYEKRLKDFFRTDIRIAFKKNGKRITQEWALDVQNIFNTQNILTQQFNPGSGKVENLYQIGLFPVPQYRIYF